MKKVITLTALALVSVGAQAATYTINSGAWTDTQSWGDNATGTSSTGDIYDNGAAGPLAILGGNSGIVNWIQGAIGTQTGTYSGTITTDAAAGVLGNVIGGTITVTGKIGNEIQVPDNSNSWWYQEYDGLVIDLSTGTSTATATNCYETALAPAPCAAITPGMLGQWTANAGPIADATNGVSNPAAPAMTFDGTTFQITNSVWAMLGDGNSTTNTLTLSSSVVPVPAAVWLFGSALGLLGWGRRKA